MYEHAEQDISKQLQKVWVKLMTREQTEQTCPELQEQMLYVSQMWVWFKISEWEEEESESEENKSGDSERGVEWGEGRGGGEEWGEGRGGGEREGGEWEGEEEEEEEEEEDEEEEAVFCTIHCTKSL